MASVTINQHERKQIINKVKDQFYKLIMASRPRPEFYSEIAEKIYYDSIDKVRDYIGTPIQKYLPHVQLNNFPSLMAGMRIKNDDITLVHVSNNPETQSKYVLQDKAYVDLHSDDIKFTPSSELVTDSKAVWISSELPDASEGAYNSKNIFITDERIAEINAFNAEMHETLDPLVTQRETIIVLIKSCKTTNQFEKYLPESLRSLYPKSVLKKIEAKNSQDNSKDVDEETLAKRQLMDDAASSLAAATLI